MRRRAEFRAAISVEARKAAASRVMLSTTIILVLGIIALALGMLAAAASGEEQVLAKLGPLAGATGWAGLVGIVLQILAAGGLLAFGTALSWLVGREFADGAVTALFALPVSRAAILNAKLIVYLVWAAAVTVTLTVTAGLLGLGMGFGTTDTAGLIELTRIPVLGVLTALIAVPAAWASTLGRGLLPGIATTVGIIVLAQLSALIGFGAWIPFVSPALWAIAPETVPLAALLIVPSVPLLFGALSALAWSKLQLDR